jgi:hypothetical protein
MAAFDASASASFGNFFSTDSRMLSMRNCSAF